MTTLKNILENELNLINYMDASRMKPLIDELYENIITHFECECGSKVLITNKAKHLKSSGHLNIKTNAMTVEKEQHYICECGSKVLITNKSRHLKSKGHNIKKEQEEDKKEEDKKEEDKKEEDKKEEDATEEEEKEEEKEEHKKPKKEEHKKPKKEEHKKPKKRRT
jgi:DNA-directed RNA polymerase subunit RPC12/RpoP